jgi:hypothetical protein
VPEFCTCGAQLPPDALFCHKCGKPQRADLVQVEEAPVPVVEARSPVDAPPPPINLRNGAAVRAALLSCLLAVALLVLLGPMNMGLLALLLGGFAAVFLYRRRTGLPLSVVNGMQLGWIAGIFVFTLIVVLTTLTVATLSQPEIAEQVRQQLLKSSLPAEDVAKFFESMKSPSGLGLQLLDSFIQSTVFMGIGAAAGAKLIGHR